MKTSVLGLVWAAALFFLLIRANARRNSCARCEVRRAEKGGGVRDILLERMSRLSGSDPINSTGPTKVHSERVKNLRQSKVRVISAWGVSDRAYAQRLCPHLEDNRSGQLS